MVRTVLYAGRRAGLGHERTRAARNVGQEPGALEKWMRILFVHPEGNLVRTLSIRRGSGQNPADRWKAFKDLKGMGMTKI